MTFDLRLRAYQPGTDTPLGFLPEPLSWQIAVVHNNDGALFVKYSELADGGQIAARTLNQGLDVAVEANWAGGPSGWVEPDNGRFLEIGHDVDPTDEAKVHDLTFTSWSWLLNKVCDLNLSALQGKKSKYAGQRLFAASKDVGDVCKTLLDEHDARSGPAVPVLRDSWTATKDSGGHTWSKTLGKNTDGRTFPPGQPLHDKLTTFAQNGLCDWRTRGRGLRIYNPNSASVDRSGTVRLSFGDDLVDAPSTMSQADRVARILVKGDGKHKVTVNDPSVPELYGRWEALVDASGVKDNDDLEDTGQAELADRNRIKGEHTRTLTMSGTFLPFRDYNVGDWVTAPGASGDERLRVMQITITRDEQNGLSGNLVLGDRFTTADLALAGRVSAITGGSTGVIGNGSLIGEPQVDTRQPAAPTNLSATAELYTEPRRWRARALLEWDPVSQATDGTELDIDHYTVVGQRAGEEWQGLTNVGANTTTATIDGLAPGEEWVFAVAAVGVTTTETGVQSAPVTILLPVDTDPPAKPSPGELSSSASILTVAWDGLTADGQPMDADLDYVRVRAGTTSPPTQVIGRLQGRGAWSGYTNAGETVYVCLEAVDWAGNTSPLSDITEITISSILDDPGLQAVLATTARIYMQDDEPTIDVPAGSWWFTRTRTAERPLKLSYTEHGTVDGVTVWEIRTLDASAAITAGTVVSSLIGAEAIRAYHIAAGEITADKIGAGLLSAQITLSGIIRTAETGKRVTLDATGITLYDENDTPITFINTDGESVFTGTVSATTLTVSGRMELQSDSNVLIPGAVLTLNSGIVQPANPPTITNYWPVIATLTDANGAAISPTAIYRDTAGNWWSLNPTYAGLILRNHDATGAQMAFWRLEKPDWIDFQDTALAVGPGPEILGQSYQYLYMLTHLSGGYLSLFRTAIRHDREYLYLNDINGQAGFDSTWAAAGGMRMAFDGSDLVIGYKSSSNNRETFRSVYILGEWTDTPELSVTTVTNSAAYASTSPTPKGFAVGTFDRDQRHYLYGSDSIFRIARHAGGLDIPTGAFPPPSTNIIGAGYGTFGAYTGFWSADAAGRVYSHGGLFWSDDSSLTRQIRAGYAYRNPAPYESKLSPEATLASKKRAHIRVSVPGWTPGDPISQLRFYTAITTGTQYAQGDNANGFINLTSPATSGSTPQTHSTFPTATPSKITNSDGTMHLKGDGALKIVPELFRGYPIKWVGYLGGDTATLTASNYRSIKPSVLLGSTGEWTPTWIGDCMVMPFKAWVKIVLQVLYTSDATTGNRHLSIHLNPGITASNSPTYPAGRRVATKFAPSSDTAGGSVTFDGAVNANDQVMFIARTTAATKVAGQSYETQVQVTIERILD